VSRFLSVLEFPVQRRHLLSLIAISPLFATSAFAAEEKKKEEKKGEKKEGKDAKEDTKSGTVELTPIALPVLWKGVIVNYVYVRLRLHLVRVMDVTPIRAKEAYVRDSVVRAAHRKPFLVPGDVNKIDEKALAEAFMADAPRAVGPGLIKSIEVFQQTPQRRLPRPPN
jgi:hypothetical protein